MIRDKSKRENLIAATIGLSVLSALLMLGHCASWYHKHFWYKTARRTQLRDLDIDRKVKRTSRGDSAETRIRYKFLVDGKEYQGEVELLELFRVEPESNIRAGYDTVYYDPRDPATNSIRGPGIKLIVFTGYSLALSFLGALFVLSTLYERRSLRVAAEMGLKVLIVPLLIPLLLVLYKPHRRA